VYRSLYVIVVLQEEGESICDSWKVNLYITYRTSVAFEMPIAEYSHLCSQTCLSDNRFSDGSSIFGGTFHWSIEMVEEKDTSFILIWKCKVIVPS
jgi:hypothetical protein